MCTMPAHVEIGAHVCIPNHNTNTSNSVTRTTPYKHQHATNQTKQSKTYALQININGTQATSTTQPDIITVQETNQTTPRHQLYQSKHLFTLTELEWWLLTYIKLNLNTHNVEIQAVIVNSNKHKNITEGRKIQSLYTTTRCYLTT